MKAIMMLSLSATLLAGCAAGQELGSGQMLCTEQSLIPASAYDAFCEQLSASSNMLNPDRWRVFVGDRPDQAPPGLTGGIHVDFGRHGTLSATIMLRGEDGAWYDTAGPVFVSTMDTSPNATSGRMLADGVLDEIGKLDLAITD